MPLGVWRGGAAMNTQLTSGSAWIFSLVNSKKMSQVSPGTVKTPEEDTHSHPVSIISYMSI